LQKLPGAKAHKKKAVEERAYIEHRDSEGQLPTIQVPRVSKILSSREGSPFLVGREKSKRLENAGSKKYTRKGRRGVKKASSR